MASEVGKPGGSAERGATPEDVARALWRGLLSVEAIAAALRQAHAAGEAQGWAEGRDAAAAHMRALCDKNEGKLFCDGIAGENCRWVSELRGLKP